MSGYIGLNRTGFGPFDDSLSLIEEAGDSYHHTSKWLDEGWNGEKPYIDRINESIEFAANSYSDLIDALTALKAELREICAVIDDPACDLMLTTVECITKLKAENESLKLDAERLDFILRKQLIVIQDCDDKYFTYNAQSGKRGPEMDSEAEAIDAAIAKGEQG